MKRVIIALSLILFLLPSLCFPQGRGVIKITDPNDTEYFITNLDISSGATVTDDGNRKISLDITGSAEADTLATVTGRGATTSTGLTLSGNNTLSGTNTITYTALPALTSQGAAGDIGTYTVDASATCTAFTQPYFFASDGELEVADASDPNNLAQVLAITTGTGASKTCLKRGNIWDGGGWTCGEFIYLSEDPNTPCTQTAPTTSGAMVQVLGYCEDDPNQWFFNPSYIAFVND